MKIIIKRNEQSPEIVINSEGVHYIYAVRNMIAMALELDGYSKETINEVFNYAFEDAVKCEEFKAEGYNGHPQN